MQAIMETLFDAVYLISVITIGILMIRGSRGNSQFRLFGFMAVVLGAGDAFHLIPRAYALCTTGLEHYAVPLGLGKWITSVTMTIFYVLLYYVWRQRYRVKGQGGLTAMVFLLAGLRIFLCMMPQNQWLSPDAPLSWVTTQSSWQFSPTTVPCMMIEFLTTAPRPILTPRKMIEFSTVPSMTQPSAITAFLALALMPYLTGTSSRTLV